MTFRDPDRCKSLCNSLMTVAFSGLFRELMMTKPKPSFSLRLITTSLVCRADPSGGEVATVAATTGGPEAEAASLRGELCCVDTEPGLRPFTGHGSPEGEDESRRDESAHSGHWVFTVSRKKELKMKDVATDKNQNNSGLLQSQQGFCVKVKLGFSACHLWLFCNRLPLREKRTQKDTNHRACCCRADNEQRINVCMIYYHRKDVWVRSTQRSCAQTVSMCAVSKLCFFNLMPVKCAACSPILVKCEKKDKNTKQKRTEKKSTNKTCPHQAFALSFSQSSWLDHCERLRASSLLRICAVSQQPHFYPQKWAHPRVEAARRAQQECSLL